MGVEMKKTVARKAARRHAPGREERVVFGKQNTGKLLVKFSKGKVKMNTLLELLGATGSYTVQPVDASGNPVAGATLSAVSSDPTVFNPGSFNGQTAQFSCTQTGGTCTLTITATLAGWNFTPVEFTVTVAAAQTQNGTIQVTFSAGTVGSSVAPAAKK